MHSSRDLSNALKLQEAKDESARLWLACPLWKLQHMVVALLDRFLLETPKWAIANNASRLSEILAFRDLALASAWSAWISTFSTRCGIYKRTREASRQMGNCEACLNRHAIEIPHTLHGEWFHGTVLVWVTIMLLRLCNKLACNSMLHCHGEVG